MPDERFALVTGGSRGLGAEIALALAVAGHSVAVNYLGNEKAAGETAKRLVGESFALRADVGDLAQVREMAVELKKRWGRLDVLVNCAGVINDALLARFPDEAWDRVFRTNLDGCLNTMREFFPLLKASGGGHIVNVSSRTALCGKEGQAAYSASKAALLGLTNVAAAEFGHDNIRVNAIMPGYLPTEMGRKNQRAMQRATEESFLGKLSDPAEAASFVLWLAGTKNITGQVFVLDSRQGNSRLPGVMDDE